MGILPGSWKYSKTYLWCWLHNLVKFTKNQWIIHLKWVNYMIYKCLYKFVKKIIPHQDALITHQRTSRAFCQVQHTCLIIFYLFVYMSVSFLSLGSSHIVAILSICLNDWHPDRYSRNQCLLHWNVLEKRIGTS